MAGRSKIESARVDDLRWKTVTLSAPVRLRQGRVAGRHLR